MAITRYDANSLSKLKTCLEMFVGDEGGNYTLFKAVEFDDDNSPTEIICTDFDDNTIFTVSLDNGKYAYTAYKTDQTSVSVNYSNSSSNLTPEYLYKVGYGAAIKLAHQSNMAVIFITKTSGGVTCFALPYLYNSSTAPTGCKVAAYGDTSEDDGTRNIRPYGTRSEGNHAQLTPIVVSSGGVCGVGLYGMYVCQFNIPDGSYEALANDTRMFTNCVVALLDSEPDNT